jgi:hypothetical protein
MLAAVSIICRSNALEATARRRKNLHTNLFIIQENITCIREVLTSIVGRDTAILTEAFRCFPQYLQANARTTASFQIHSNLLLINDPTIRRCTV